MAGKYHTLRSAEDVQALRDSLPQPIGSGDVIVAKTGDFPTAGNGHTGPALVVGTPSHDARDVLYVLRLGKSTGGMEDGDLNMNDDDGANIQGFCFPVRLRMNSVYTSYVTDNFRPKRIGQVSSAFMTRVKTALVEMEKTKGLRLDDSQPAGTRKAILHKLMPSSFAPVREVWPQTAPRLFDTFLERADGGLSVRSYRVLQQTQMEFEAGRYADAETHLLTLVEAQQNCQSGCAPLTRAALGILHERLGEVLEPDDQAVALAEAVKDYQAVLQMQPDNAVARQGLARCAGTLTI